MVESTLFWAIYFIYTLLGPIEALDGGNYCLSELCPRFKRHIACRHKGQMAKLCPNDTQLIDMSYYRNLIVNEHNELRNLLASGQMKQLPNPDRLATMQWHEELGKLATLNVKQCLFNYDQCHNTLEFRNSGQNLIMLNISTLDDSPSSRPTNETLIKYSIHSWWNQWRNVTWQHVEKFPKDKHLTNSLRHFAVMARDNSTYLGCAATRWLKQNVHHFLFACNYASNFIVDKPIYKLKTINCQIGYDKKYPGLCKAGEQYDKSLTLCYQRQSVNNNNHNNAEAKPTHLPPSSHYPHGHKWNEPYFDLTMPRNITSLVGKSAYLGCRVKHLGNKTVAWIRHRDLHILTVGTYTYTTDQRFQTSYHRDIDEWTLQIKWAQQRDAGVYECQISTQPVRSYSVNLNIVDLIDAETSSTMQQYYNDDAFYIAADRVYQSSDDEFAGMFGPIQTVAVPTATILGGPDLYVDKGSTINLTCIIKFSPEPPTHIFWYHQDKVLSEETSGGRLKFKTIKSEETKSILLIYDADLLHSGKYSCYPSNTEIASIRVHVLQGERPEAMQTNAAPAAVALACWSCHMGQATQAVKVISTMVAAFVLLEACSTLLLQGGQTGPETAGGGGDGGGRDGGGGQITGHSRSQTTKGACTADQNEQAQEKITLLPGCHVNTSGKNTR